MIKVHPEKKAGRKWRFGLGEKQQEKQEGFIFRKVSKSLNINMDMMKVQLSLNDPILT